MYNLSLAPSVKSTKHTNGCAWVLATHLFIYSETKVRVGFPAWVSMERYRKSLCEMLDDP